MLKLRINPIVAKDLKNIRDYIAEDNKEYAAKTMWGIGIEILREFLINAIMKKLIIVESKF